MEMKKSRAYATILCAIIAIVIVAYQAVIGFSVDGSSAANIKQGLDLAGGVSITYEVVGDEVPSAEDMNDTQKKLEQRVQQYSTEAIVYQEGEDRFSIEIPGVSDADAILADLGRPGSLYFIAQTSTGGELNYTLVYPEAEDQEPYYELLRPIEELEEDGSIVIYGTDVAEATAGSMQSQTGTEIVVELVLTEEGTVKFADATARAAGKETIGIYYDGTFVSVPMVNSAISNGIAQITGMSDFQEAEDLASTIRIGGLSLELEEVYNRVVGAQLGEEALETSIWAGGIGLLLVMLFMIIVYRIPGLAAAIALLLYAPTVVVLIHGFDLTLTLPGVAGIILSIGMAVDANVIIFARIREEIAAGQVVKDAMREGFAKAFSAIVDGNITTLIAATVLMFMGSGVIKGFAQTLMLGIALSMFTALVVTKLLVHAFYAVGFKDIKFYGKSISIKMIDYISKFKIFVIASTVVVVVGLGMLFVNTANTGNPLNYGLEFVGGTSTSVIFNEPMSLEIVDSQVVSVVSEVVGDSPIQPQVVDGSQEVIIKTRSLEQEEREALRVALVEEFDIDSDLITSETISSTISEETRTETVLAIVVAVVCMLLYIRLRFKDIRFGVSSVVALVHDVLIVLTFYAVTQITVGNTFIACMLTIVGYSINATIVIFDRIRENLKEEVSEEKLEQLVNTSITSTMTRSLFTSITTLIMVVVLYIFGVTSIREFALPLIVGIICGTYSSVFITGPLWYVLRKKFVPKPVEEEEYRP